MLLNLLLVQLISNHVNLIFLFWNRAFLGFGRLRQYFGYDSDNSHFKISLQSLINPLVVPSPQKDVKKGIALAALARFLLLLPYHLGYFF